MATGQPQQVVYQQPPQQVVYQQPQQVVYQQGQPQQVVMVQQQPQQVVYQQGQPQQVVMVQRPMGTNEGGFVSGGTVQTMQQPVQTVVVMQQPQQQTVVVQQAEGNRYTRFAYLIFMIGYMVWNFFSLIFFLIMTFAPDGWGWLFFFCGFVPSAIAFGFAIADSTVFCANPGTGQIAKICCCDCISGPVMAIPMMIAAFLRLILWCAFLGIVTDISDESSITDNILWLFLAFVALDVGPMVLLAIDWWWYYAKHEYDALFGTKLNPLRCIVGLNVVICLHSSGMLGCFAELSEAEFLWPWIIHCVLSAAILVWCAFINFSGGITGAYVTSQVYRYICLIMGVIQIGEILVVIGHVFDAIFTWDGGWVLFWYGLYYASLTVPIVWALFSIKWDPNGPPPDDKAGDNPV
eukprot:86286_1